MIAGWLKAGVFEAGKGSRRPRRELPQGGVISPLLLNVALHGLEEAAGVRYRDLRQPCRETVPGSPVLVRYADDLVVLCHSQEQAEQVKARLAEWLAPRGLAFNEDKTRIVHLDEGFDFLGFNVRRYRNGKLLIKPSKAAVRRIRERLAAEMRALRGANATAVIAALNPIIRGWAAYYRTVVSTRVFAALDDYLWRLTYKWASCTPPEQAEALDRRPVLRQVQQFRNDRWVFGDRDSGAYLLKFAWTEHRPAPAGQGRGVPRRPRPGRLLGQARRRAPAPRSAPRPGTCCAASTAAARSAGACCSTPATSRTTTEWEQWLTTRKAIRKQAIDRLMDPAPRASNRIPPHPRPLPPAHGGSKPSTSARPAPRACLSRVPGNGTHGSEGAPARQRAGATRRDRVGVFRAAAHPARGPRAALG